MEGGKYIWLGVELLVGRGGAMENGKWKMENCLSNTLSKGATSEQRAEA